jgi:hypothetical protein
VRFRAVGSEESEAVVEAAKTWTAAVEGHLTQ